MADPELLTPEQVSKVLGIPEQLVLKRLRRDLGAGPQGGRNPGGSYCRRLIPRSWVEQELKQLNHETVRCLECGSRLTQITYGHLKSHSLTLSDYRSKYPDAELTSTATHERLAQRKQCSREATADRLAKMRAKRWSTKTPADARRVRKRKQQARERMTEVSTRLWQDPDYRAMQTAKARDQLKDWWSDPDYRKRISKARRASWTTEKRDAVSRRTRDMSIALWKDPEHRLRMKEVSVDRWTKPEQTLRDILRSLECYRESLDDPRYGFVAHGWIPTAGAGFSANADFIDYRRRRIIHVDGVYWHSKPEMKVRDQRLDRWCDANDWAYVRITDADLKHRRAQVEQLVADFVLP